MAKRPDPYTATMKLALIWLPTVKEWHISYDWYDGERWHYSFLNVDTGVCVDGDLARRVASAVGQELLAVLW